MKTPCIRGVLLVAEGIARGLALLIAGAAISAASEVSDFYWLREGTLPIVISAPHGGGMVPPNVSPRVCDQDGEVCVNDQNTQLLAAAVDDALASLTGQRSHQVINLVNRLYIDHNRSNSANPNGANEAYEDADARPYYEFYHDSLRASVDQVLDEYGRGLLIDIHGQSRFDNTVIRGTRNGQTVERLLETSGEGALTGPNSVFGHLEQLGYPVTPPNAPLSEEREVFFNGGHIVATYGSHRTQGIDAIQIEFSRNLRVSSGSPEVWVQSANDLAEAIVVFMQTYLTEPELPGDFNGDGRVDAADYTVWRDNFGTESLLPGDRTPGRVTQGDFTDWSSNYGAAIGVREIPEPNTSVLTAIVSFATGFPRRPSR